MVFHKEYFTIWNKRAMEYCTMEYGGDTINFPHHISLFFLRLISLLFQSFFGHNDDSFEHYLLNRRVKRDSHWGFKRELCGTWSSSLWTLLKGVNLSLHKKLRFNLSLFLAEGSFRHKVKSFIASPNVSVYPSKI